MGLFNKMRGPVFLKEDSDAKVQLKQLKDLEPLLNEEGKKKINQDIKYLEYGIIGEDNIAFELKNSNMPMYVLHDIYLEYEGLSAQIDYLIFTKKICFVIECKNLYGDIEIDNNGSFIRTMELNGKKIKKGIYSPITQNQRHLELIKRILLDRKGNFLSKFILDKNFENYYKSIVVLANANTVLNARFAKKEVKEKVIRGDQLINYIKEMCKQSKEFSSSEEELRKQAEKFLGFHTIKVNNYIEEYNSYLLEKNERVTEKLEEIVTPMEEMEIYKELKAYRLEMSRKENIQPYIIYNNKQLEDLIQKMPRTIEQLQKVSGFGEVKTSKYGKDIITILSKYQ